MSRNSLGQHRLEEAISRARTGILVRMATDPPENLTEAASPVPDASRPVPWFPTDTRLAAHEEPENN